MARLIHLVAGARPNFMKIAPIVRALRREAGNVDFRIVHTGQHYDHAMSGVFFDELGIPEPDFHLECGGGGHSEQTARIMVAFDRVCAEHRPDAVLVVGDVNSTAAAAIVAKKMGIRVAHVEAGLRSFDRSMPEEINRLVTDSISDWFYCTEPSGVAHLLAEGKPAEDVVHVGHVMVDNLLYQCERLQQAGAQGLASTALKSALGRYGVVTLHRPSNVDDAQQLRRLVQALEGVAMRLPLVFPVHPRTRANLERFGIATSPGIHLTDPLAYMDFLNLWKDAAVVLTDSGGLQEETTALGVPCLTLRSNTERPITVEEGTNILVGADPVLIEQETVRILDGLGKRGSRPALWDGQAAARIAAHLRSVLN